MRLAAAVVILAGCGGPGDGVTPGPIDAAADGDELPPACTPVIGDLGQPMEVVPVRAGGEQAIDIEPGASVPLMAPPQGGIVLLAGGRARNLDGCAAQVTASLRDPGTGMVIGLESRPSQLVASADGWGRPSGALFFALANVAVCPSAAATRDVFGNPWELEIRIDDGVRQGEARLSVVPSCDDAIQPDFCRCVCSTTYMPGDCPGPFG